MAEMPDAEIGLTLRQFGFPNPWQEDHLDDYEYVIIQLEQADDSALVELQRHLHPEDSPSPHAGDEGPWDSGAFRLFISHTNQQRERAGALRASLAPWGVDAFVARDTIEPTREWQDEIESALRTCDALCALLTPDFVASRWCDQEVGFAVARSIPVVPLKLDTNPHGFIGKYQALTPAPGDNAWAVADKLFEALAKHPQAADAMAPAIVRRYEKSRSFDNTRSAFALMQAIPKTAWTPTMIEQVLRAGDENSQVQNANLLHGGSIPAAAREMLDALLPEPSTSTSSDDDIPF